MEAVTRPLLAVLALLLAYTPADAPACEGRVGADGHGIAGVLVSDGRNVVDTDATGRYALPSARAGGELFVVAPDGWQPATGPDGLPAFWRAGCGDFALERIPRSRAADTRVLVFSDPQAGSSAQADHYAKAIVTAAMRETGIGLGMTLGDVVDDTPGLYPRLNRATASLGVPWLHAAGNHDVDVDASDDATSLASFRATYGPDSFAWRAPRVTFVVLDNVVALPGQHPAYVGGLREDQFAFLEHFLPHAPRDRLLVVAAHIPWFDTARPGRAETVRSGDRQRLFALLRHFPQVLLLSGHRHTQRQFFHDAATGWHGGRPLREYNVGAASGAYWSGIADADGVPVATMADGTPKGYATLVVRDGGGYRLEWHPVGLPPDEPALTQAMALHAPRVLRRGAYPAWAAYANVFMGHDDTRVEYRIDEGEWKPMAKLLAPDPRLLAENARDDFSDVLRSRDRSPEAEPSTHLWRGALDTGLSAGAHRIEVRAFDDDGVEHLARTTYRLDEWED